MHAQDDIVCIRIGCHVQPKHELILLLQMILGEVIDGLCRNFKSRSTNHIDLDFLGGVH